MPVKTITNATGNTFRFGRKKPAGQITKLKLKDYLSTTLPPAPDCDYAAAAQGALTMMYGNDTYGDCVIACMGHLFGVLRENAAGNSTIFSDGEIINQYSRCCGYVPGDPNSDQGCDIQETISDILQDGFKGHRKQAGEKVKLSHRIAGWLTVDGTNKEEVRQAIYLFENVVIGLDLPDAWIEPFPSASGFEWNVAGPPDPENGHCVIGCATSPSGVGIGTWGMTGTMTYAAVAEYAVPRNDGELYAVLSEDSINRAKGLAPNGVSWEQLQADFKSLGGSVSG
jgi:hypothetical protein